MREIALAALVAACSGGVVEHDQGSPEASPAPCLQQCHALDVGDCPGEPALFYETCTDNCYVEAASQQAECVDAFNAMWDCRLRELVGICDSAGEPVGTYDGRCIEESELYSLCAE